MVPAGRRRILFFYSLPLHYFIYSVRNAFIWELWHFWAIEHLNVLLENVTLKTFLPVVSLSDTLWFIEGNDDEKLDETRLEKLDESRLDPALDPLYLVSSGTSISQGPSNSFSDFRFLCRLFHGLLRRKDMLNIFLRLWTFTYRKILNTWLIVRKNMGFNSYFPENFCNFYKKSTKSW